MNKKNFLLGVFGFFLLPFFASGQSQGTGSSASGRTAFDVGDLSGALSLMDSILEADEEPTAIDEYYLGRAVAANIMTFYRPYSENPELTRYLNRICQTIAVNSPQPELFNGYHVIVLDSSELNAFASPGGHILITKGLVEAAASEDMLAAVIAHEFAHILLRHGTGIIADMRLNDELAATANRAGEIASRNSSVAAKAVLFRNSVNELVDVLMKNGYSQSQEFDADNAAVTLLAASGYNPGALFEVLQIILKTNSSRADGLFSTHPNTLDRINNAAQRAGRYRIPDTSSYRTTRFRNN